MPKTHTSLCLYLHFPNNIEAPFVDLLAIYKKYPPFFFFKTALAVLELALYTSWP